MKILVATGLFPPQVGGPATYSKLLLERLPEKGFKVWVESFGKFLKYPVVVRHVLYFFKLLVSAWRVDVVYALDPVSVGLPAFAVSKLLGKKFYIKIVGDYAWEQGTQRFGVEEGLDTFSLSRKGYSAQVRLLKWIQRAVANGADKVLVPSEYLKQIVSNWGVSAEKITVIYNSFSYERTARTKEGLRSQLGWQGKVVVSAGRLVPWKGFDTLIETWPEVRKEVPDAVLIIAGDGPDLKRLGEQVESSPASSAIHLRGRVEQQELFDMVRAADAFVLNTGYEGLSHQLLEVMALETPIVTTNVGGNPEVIIDGESGILVPYDDPEALKSSMVKLLGNQELALKLVMNGKNRLARFDEDQMLDKLVNFLRG